MFDSDHCVGIWDQRTSPLLSCYETRLSTRRGKTDTEGVSPPKMADLKYCGLFEEDRFEIPKPRYGMTDSGHYWGVTVDRHINHDLRLVSPLGDPRCL